MRYYLNAGFGNPLPPGDFDLIQRLGYDGIRQDVPSPLAAVPLAANVLSTGTAAIFVIPVHDPSTTQLIAHELCEYIVRDGSERFAVLEVGNEEDLRGKRWANDPRGWARLVEDVGLISIDHSGGSIRVVSGGVSSLSKDAMRWLEVSEVASVSSRVAIGYHQYRSTPPEKPLAGYRSRGEEFVRLSGIAGSCEVWCTETGWHTAPRKSGWWLWAKRWSYTDDQVAEFLATELSYNEEIGAGAFVTYQLNDGPNPLNDQDRFGIRRMNGELKPSAFLLEGVAR